MPVHSVVVYIPNYTNLIPIRLSHHTMAPWMCDATVYSPVAWPSLRFHSYVRKLSCVCCWTLLLWACVWEYYTEGQSSPTKRQASYNQSSPTKHQSLPTKYQSSPTKHLSSPTKRHLPNVRLHRSVLHLPNVRPHLPNVSPYLPIVRLHISISIFTYHVSHPSCIHSPLVSHAQNTLFHQSDGCMKTCDLATFCLVCVSGDPHTVKCCGCE